MLHKVGMQNNILIHHWPTVQPSHLRKQLSNIRKKRKLDYISIDSEITLLENSVKDLTPSLILEVCGDQRCS